jgi:hypothetical protein
MRSLPTLDALLMEYQVAVQVLHSKGELTIEKGFDLVVTFYREVRIGAAVPDTGSDEDMLLFQYGIYNWYDARGEYFGLDMTRQLITEEEEEQVICQLSFAFEFDAAPFSGVNHYNCWSPMLSALTDWASSQKATAGFKLAQTVAFRGLNIGLQEV